VSASTNNPTSPSPRPSEIAEKIADKVYRRGDNDWPFLAEAIASALQDARRAALDAQWQPISTAPKDGRSIIVYVPDQIEEPVLSVFWQHDAWFTGWMVWSCRSDGWQVIPTRWQPLPEPPLPSPSPGGKP
jgi:hypothetical protein